MFPRDQKRPFIALIPAIERAEKLGMSISRTLENTGISPEQIISKETNRLIIDHQLEFLVYKNIQAYFDTPDIGLHLGSAYTLNQFGPLGSAMKASMCLADSFQIASLYQPLSLSFFRISSMFEKSSCQGGVVLVPPRNTPRGLLKLFTDRATASVIHNIEKVINRRGTIIRIRLPHSETSHHSTYQQFFECDIEYGHKCIEIIVDAQTLALPPAQRKPSSFSNYIQDCETECELSPPTGTLSHDISRRLNQMHAKPWYNGRSRFPNSIEMARLLGLTNRTLRRNLEKEGTNYQSILNNCRTRFARHQIINGNPISEIAQELGFSDAYAFSKAFKNWFSIPPKVYRQRLTST